jgi:hypothetical protein
VVEPEVVVIELLKPVASEVVAEVAKIEPELLEKEVKLQLPFKGETAAYLEVEIEGIGKWLSKASLDRWSISQGTVRVVMTRAQAARRKLVAA